MKKQYCWVCNKELAYEDYIWFSPYDEVRTCLEHNKNAQRIVSHKSVLGIGEENIHKPENTEDLFTWKGFKK